MSITMTNLYNAHVKQLNVVSKCSLSLWSTFLSVSVLQFGVLQVRTNKNTTVNSTICTAKKTSISKQVNDQLTASKLDH